MHKASMGDLSLTFLMDVRASPQCTTVVFLQGSLPHIPRQHGFRIVGETDLAIPTSSRRREEHQMTEHLLSDAGIEMNPASDKVMVS